MTALKLQAAPKLRLLSQEPTGADGPNLYWALRNNPLIYTDPDGRKAAIQNGGAGSDYGSGGAAAGDKGIEKSAGSLAKTGAVVGVCSAGVAVAPELLLLCAKSPKLCSTIVSSASGAATGALESLDDSNVVLLPNPQTTVRNWLASRAARAAARLLRESRGNN